MAFGLESSGLWISLAWICLRKVASKWSPFCFPWICMAVAGFQIMIIFVKCWQLVPDHGASSEPHCQNDTSWASRSPAGPSTHTEHPWDSLFSDFSALQAEVCVTSWHATPRISALAFLVLPGFPLGFTKNSFHLHKNSRKPERERWHLGHNVILANRLTCLWHPAEGFKVLRLSLGFLRTDTLGSALPKAFSLPNLH